MSEPRYPYVHVSVPADEAELVSDQLWVLGAQGVEERDATTMSAGEGEGVLLVASFPDDTAAHRAVAELTHPARVEHVVGDAWRDAWREHFHPQKIGARLLLRPSWREVEPAEGDVVLTIDPGGAFGSGIHETTRLCLAEVDRRVRGGERVFDAGCGSGILSVAALLLGAAEAVAVDVEDNAVPVSEENAEANGVEARLRVSTTPIEEVEGAFELVLANIQAPILIALAEPIAARVAPGGALVLSGVLAERAEEVEAAYRAEGLAHEATEAESEWRAIVMTRLASG